ncbi:MAG: hypothetical protein IID36_14035 [Planctomycetes bacterium]|nr:hypothetical protein [Planctomycetota bacterium]
MNTLTLTSDAEAMEAPSAAVDGRGFVHLNDLLADPSYVRLLEAHGLTSLEALFGYESGERLEKSDLGGWRVRMRVSLDAVVPGAVSDFGTGSKRNMTEIESASEPKIEARMPRVVYLKRFENPPPGEQRRARASSTARSLAGVEWEWIRRLTDDGIACPRGIALGEEIVGHNERRSALIMDAVPGESLECWCERWHQEGQIGGALTKRRLLEALADFIALFHGKGYVHRDLYLSHVFFDPDAAPERALHLIDLQRVKRPRWRRWRWIVKDLASLNYSTPAGSASRSDRLRWLKRYLGAVELDRTTKRIAHAVVRKTRRIARHDRRRAGGRTFSRKRGLS